MTNAHITEIQKITRPKMLMSAAMKLAQHRCLYNKASHHLPAHEIHKLIKAEATCEENRLSRTHPYEAERHVLLLALLIEQSFDPHSVRRNKLH